MVERDKNYPNLTWPQFAVCNDDPTKSFEDMSRCLFRLEFLEKGDLPHSNHNTPGVEVLPILETQHLDGSKRRKISFQAKYFEDKVSYSQIKNSMDQAIKCYGNELDLIYLFCNKTLTTTAKGYIDIKEKLKTSEIELHPISNTEVLDLVMKYKEIANYFFLPRRRPGDAQMEQIYAGIVIHNENDREYNSSLIKPNEQVIDITLIQALVQEKIEICKSLVLDMRFDKLREELDKIFAYKLTGVVGYETLLFYKLIMELHDNKESEFLVDGLTEQDKGELSWMKEYYKNPVPVGTYTFASHRIESQTLVLDKMFSSQLWNAVIVLCKEIVDDASSEILDTVKQYYGLALFNLQKYNQASEILKGLYQKSRKESHHLYSILAEIKSINDAWREGHYEQRERLIELIKQLDLLKDNTQYKGNKSLVAMIYLESAYNLGMNEKEYLEAAIEKYQEFPNDVKNEKVVKYLYALCLEMNGNIETAEGIYAGLDWKNNVNIACRYLICKLLCNDYAGVVRAYKEVTPSAMHTKLNGLYLRALYYEDKDAYKKKLKEALSEEKDNLEGIIDIALGVHEKQYLEDDVIPLIKRHVNTEMDKLVFRQKEELISILSHAGELALIVTLLKSIHDIVEVKYYIVREIYEAVFAATNRELIGYEKSLNKSEKLKSAELIADIFLEANVSRKEFLQIKYICAEAKGKRFSMLKYAKELFEIKNEEILARDIIAMLLERNETDFNAYTSYLAVLCNSVEPEYCMAVAFAMLRLGKMEEADFYAYKALYYLNGIDNYEIYKNYFGYYNQNLNRYHDRNELTRVKNNCVVTLEEGNPRNGEKAKVITLCLDSESEFSDSSNRSLMLRHIPSGCSLYLKLQGSSLNQMLKIENVNYRLINIQSRVDYTAGFIFGKISEHPEKFGGAVLVLSSEKPEELIKKIKSVTDKTEQTEAMLDLYHFKKNKMGLPIDSFTNGDYDRYIDALSMLLYTKDQAFYTGLWTYEDERNQRYVPALSTLVLLSFMNILNVLEEIRNKLILPASYMNFFAERYRKAKETSFMASGKLTNVNDQLTLIQDDVSQAEIWERIIDFCAECEIVNISDDDRIEFSIDDINGEQFIAALRLNLIHLDSFLLAKKEQATLLCDDLFFRRIATYGKIRNINFVSLLRHNVNDDFVVPIIMELSKTNYIYIPLMARTDEEIVQLKKNILDGKMKKKFYGNLLAAYSAVRKNFMREMSEKDGES